MIRDSFVKQFGEEQAQAVEKAAAEHANGVHDKRGSDPFRWAIAIAIGYQCMEVDRYRTHHGITADWPAIQQWIKDHAELGKHDGDVDYIALFANVYQQYIPSKTVDA